MTSIESPALRKMLGVGLVLLALFLVMARATFNINDLHWYTTAPNPVMDNVCGWLGAYFVHIVLLYFGDAYWILPFASLLLCVHVLRGRFPWLRVYFGILLSLPTFAILIVTLFPEAHPDYGISYGGYFGGVRGHSLKNVLGGYGIGLLLLGSAIALWFLYDLNDLFRDLIQEFKKKKETPVGATEVKPDSPKVQKKKEGELLVEPEQVVPKIEQEELPPPPVEFPVDIDEKKVGRDASAASIRVREDSSGGPRKPKKVVTGNFVKPKDTILDGQPENTNVDSDELLQERGLQLENLFETYKIGCKVVGMRRGPTITQFELRVDEGIKVSRIKGLTSEVAMKLKAPSVRIVAPIPGKDTIGIEVPNVRKEMVNLRSIIEHNDYQKKVSSMTLPLLLGKDVVGEPLISDLSKMPHLLVAGSTGSGKSVCINSIIISLLLHHSPESVRLVLIDPKMVEMSGYEDIPHLLTPVVTDMNEAAAILEWACVRMDERYRLLSHYRMRDIRRFNQLNKGKIKEGLPEHQEIEDIEWPMPYMVIVVDEFSDLMMVGAKEIEAYITRLAQKSRAVGIHVILATQRPSVDVVTGLIKTNMPTRIGFRVVSSIDSKTILDQPGADKLLGMGDMLMIPPGSSAPIRAQGVYISDEEINNVIDHWKDQGPPQYEELSLVPRGSGSPMGGGDAGGSGEDEGLYAQAVEAVLEGDKPSASFIQRQLRVGYNKASRLIELMEERGVVSPTRGSNKREIMITIDQWNEMKERAG